MTGLEMIMMERLRQIDSEGFDAKHDDAHTSGELINAADCYLICVLHRSLGAPSAALKDYVQTNWPWEPEWFKPDDGPLRNLAKAGALIAAEIDRQQRALEGRPA